MSRCTVACHRATLMGVLAASALACASSPGGPPPLDFATVRPRGELEGAWVGGTNVLGNYILIEADFRPTNEGNAGELRPPSENVSRLPVTDAHATDSTATFMFRSPFGVHRAEGRWDDGMIFGRIEGGGLSGDFHLLPVRRPDPEAYRRRAGSYAERPGHRLLVTPRAGGGLAWAETEPLEDGAVWIAGGTLYGYAADTVFTDRSIRGEPRRHEWAAFLGDDAIEWHPETRAPRVTRRVPDAVVQEAVVFTSGDVELAGTLLLPPGPGPHPVAVMVHGSGPAERTNLLAMLRADLLLARGVGVLVYDKRGVAGSGGDWERAGIEVLARDAAAAVELLKAHTAVAPGAVGLVGHSQAGWVIPAAARRAGANFLVVLSGGGVSPRAQEVFRARAEAAAVGLSADSAGLLMELKWAYGASGDGWEDYIAAVTAADPRLGALVETPNTPDSQSWALVRALAAYDPLPDLRAIDAPTLVVFGAADDNVPIERAADAWRDAVPSSLLTVETVPGVGHALVAMREGVGSIFPAALVRALDAWLVAQVRHGRS